MVNSPLTREALERAMHNDELVLYYQPKVCLSRGEVVGAEALVRWEDGSQEIVSPDEFLPLAEESGLLHDLTLKLLDQVIAASLELRQHTSKMAVACSAPITSVLSDVAQPVVATGRGRRAMSLSMNVAPNDLATRTISQRIGELLKAGTINARDLQIEITESAVMSNVDRVYDDLVRLKQMGIKILMDDFGTGYSSIDRLSQLPFDALKLDQGVVRRMATSRRNLDVVRSTISMARELGMTSVAEGIESEAAYNFLIAYGCEEAQGYFIARPMSLDDFVSFVSSRHDFNGSQIGRVHQMCLNLIRFRKGLIDAAFCARVGDGVALESVIDPELHDKVTESRIGTWYFGIGQALLSLPQFVQIEKPLRHLHASGQRFVQRLAAGVTGHELDRELTDIDQQVDQLINLLHSLERVLLANVGNRCEPAGGLL